MALLSASLSGLSTREAIVDSLYRTLNGFDHNDPALFDSSFTDDAHIDFGGHGMDGKETIHKECFEPVAKLDTSHYPTLVRVDVKSETTASLTANVLAQHFKTGEGLTDGPHLLAGAFYYVDYVKDATDGLWKGKNWTIEFCWRQGEPNILGL